MTRILNKIKSPIEEEIGNINTNFDRIALDLADRSGTFSSVATIPGGITVAAGNGHSIEVSIVDSLNTYQSGRLPVIPRIDVYIDNDLDGTYLWPSGGNISGTLKGQTFVTVLNSRSVINQIDDEKATTLICISNLDLFDHTFYIYFDAYYVPAPDYGVAAREQ